MQAPFGYKLTGWQDKTYSEPPFVARLVTGNDPIIGNPITPSRRVLEFAASRGAARGDTADSFDRNRSNITYNQAKPHAGPGPRGSNRSLVM